MAKMREHEMAGGAERDGVQGVDEAREAAPVADPLVPLLGEMRALFGILPGMQVSAEADEADFDNMPV